MKVLIAVSAALMMTLAAAQNNTYAACLLSSTSFNQTSGVSGNTFCTFNNNGTFARCNNTRANITAPVTCTNLYRKEEISKRATTFSNTGEVIITKLERETVALSNVPKSADGWFTLRNGQSTKVTFINSGDKSAFVDVEYKSGTVRDSKKRIGFYVYNKETPDKVFDMSAAEKVLLP